MGPDGADGAGLENGCPGDEDPAMEVQTEDHIRLHFLRVPVSDVTLHAPAVVPRILLLPVARTVFGAVNCGKDSSGTLP